jgi:hypothetical protein
MTRLAPQCASCFGRGWLRKDGFPVVCTAPAHDKPARRSRKETPADRRRAIFGKDWPHAV